jgi:hypothetical protein
MEYLTLSNDAIMAIRDHALDRGFVGDFYICDIAICHKLCNHDKGICFRYGKSVEDIKHGDYCPDKLIEQLRHMPLCPDMRGVRHGD